MSQKIAIPDSHEMIVAAVPESDREIARQLVAESLDLGRRVEKMARLLASMSEEGQAAFVQTWPARSRWFWENVRRVGQGTLIPEIATATGLAARYLGRLPVADQKVYAEGIPTVIVKGRKTDILNMDVVNMSDADRRQVFAAHGSAVRVRTPDEQRAWLAEQERRALEKEKRADTSRIERTHWTIENGRVFFHGGKVEDGFTLKEIQKVLRDLRLAG